MDLKQNPKENPKDKPKIDTEVQDKYDKLAKRAESFQDMMSKCKDEKTAVELLYEAHMMDEKAFNAAMIYFQNKSKGVKSTLDGEPLKTGIEAGLKLYLSGINEWCDFVKSSGASEKTLNLAENFWNSKIKFEQKVTEGTILNGLKIQSYFSYQALRKIRHKIMDELNKRYPGFAGGLYGAAFRVVDVDKLKEVVLMLNIQLSDLFNIHSMNSQFLNSLPELVNNEVDMNTLFNHEDVQQRFNELIKKYKDYFEAFKPAIARKPAKPSNEGDQTKYRQLTPVDDTNVRVARSPEDEELDSMPPQQRKLRLDDAKNNLRNHGFTFDQQGNVYDEDGNKVGNTTGRALENGVMQISDYIDQNGIEAARKVIQTMQGQTFDIKGEIDYMQEKNIHISRDELERRIPGSNKQEIVKLYEDAGVVETGQEKEIESNEN